METRKAGMRSDRRKTKEDVKITKNKIKMTKPKRS